MAKVKDPSFPKTHGKIDKNGNTVYRVNRGTQQSYTSSPSSVPASKAQQAYRKNFGKVTSIVNAIMADPKQTALWEQKRIEYNRTVIPSANYRFFETTRSYAHHVIREQLEQAESRKRRKTPIRKALPKGLKLHIKHFADLSTTELYELLKARFEVFYMEQNIRYQDLDNIDYNAIHLALHKKGHVIAYIRLFKGNEPDQWVLGRMLTTERGKGYGNHLMLAALSEAEKQGVKELILHAQMQVVSFYEKFGFRTFGEIFQEAGIPHVLMKKSIS